MHIGIVVTDQNFLDHALGMIDAAAARGWEMQCFLTDTGVNLLADPEFVERARARPNRISVCEHSADRYVDGKFDLHAMAGFVVIGGQYQNAELAHKCSRVLVF